MAKIFAIIVALDVRNEIPHLYFLELSISMLSKVDLVYGIFLMAND